MSKEQQVDDGISADIVDDVLESQVELNREIRLWGSLIILAILFLVAKFVVPDKLIVPPYDSANLNEAQVAEQARILENHRIPELYGAAKAEVAKLAFVPEPISVRSLMKSPISYRDYNDRLHFVPLFTMLGLGFSVALYSALFHRHRPKEEAEWKWALFFWIPFITLLLTVEYFLAVQPTISITVFFISFVSMFLLWALTRSPEPLTKPGHALAEESETPAG